MNRINPYSITGLDQLSHGYGPWIVEGLMHAFTSFGYRTPIQRHRYGIVILFCVIVDLPNLNLT